MLQNLKIDESTSVMTLLFIGLVVIGLVLAVRDLFCWCIGTSTIAGNLGKAIARLEEINLALDRANTTLDRIEADVSPPVLRAVADDPPRPVPLAGRKEESCRGGSEPRRLDYPAGRTGRPG